MNGPSARFSALPRSGIRDVFERALLVPDAVHLELGAPDFPTPAHIVEAAARAPGDGFTSYTPAAGLRTLRELAAEKVRTKNGIACSVENVTVSAGGCCGIYAALSVLLDEGEGVLLPDPSWAVYPTMVQALGGVVQRYPLLAEDGFAPDLDALEAAIGEHTRVLVVNTPSNPTGAVHDAATLAALVEIAERHDLWLLSDEAYEDVVFEGEHVSAATLDGSGRTISVFTLSKSYAMTGWRVGYVVAPAAIAAGVAQAQEPLIACASSISQKAAEAALSGPQETVALMREAYVRRRDAACAFLEEEGIPHVRPAGGFFLMVGLPGPGGDSEAFSRRALAEGRVAVVHGSAFGPGGEGMVRASLCVADDILALGLSRLAASVEVAV